MSLRNWFLQLKYKLTRPQYSVEEVPFVLNKGQAYDVYRIYGNDVDERVIVEWETNDTIMFGTPSADEEYTYIFTSDPLRTAMEAAENFVRKAQKGGPDINHVVYASKNGRFIRYD